LAIIPLITANNVKVGAACRKKHRASIEELDLLFARNTKVRKQSRRCRGYPRFNPGHARLADPRAGFTLHKSKKMFIIGRGGLAAQGRKNVFSIFLQHCDL
jgi:hypothetical protein